MKKFVSVVCGVILCITVAIGWYSANHQSLIAGIGVSPIGTNGQLLVGKDTFAVNMELNDSAELVPVTSKNGKQFFTCENGALTANTATQDGVSYTSCDSGWYETKVNLKASGEEYGTLYVSNITCTGAVDDEISKAIRVSVTWFGESRVFQPIGNNKYLCHDGTQPKIYAVGESCKYGNPVSADGGELAIRVWYEGQDPLCTANNCELSTGEVEISVELTAK